MPVVVRKVFINIGRCARSCWQPQRLATSLAPAKHARAPPQYGEVSSRLGERYEENQDLPFGLWGDDAPLPENTRVVNALRRDQVVHEVHVARVDEDGRGIVYLFVRKDKQVFEFSFDRVLPGEKLQLRVASAKHDRYNKRQPGRYQLSVVGRDAASPDEVVPICTHFGQGCGGCSFQNLAYDAQLREKRALLELRLRQYGLLGCRSESADAAVGDIVVRDVVGSQSIQGFQSRTEFRFFLRGGLRMGLHPVRSALPVQIARCHRHPDEAQDAFESTLRAAQQSSESSAPMVFDPRTGQGWLCSAVFRTAARAAGGFDVLVTFVTTPDAPFDILIRLADSTAEGCSHIVGVTWSPTGGETRDREPGWRSGIAIEQHKLLRGQPFLTHSVGGESIALIPEAFWRPNLFISDIFYSVMLALGEVQNSDVVWDAFCGQGFLAMMLARECRHVVALDRSEPALAALRVNLANSSLAGISGVIRPLAVDLGSPAELRALCTGLPPDVLGRMPWGASHLHGSAVTHELEVDEEENEEDGSEKADSAARRLRLTAASTALLAPDVVYVDPGRNGMPKAFRRMLGQMRARVIVYVGFGRPFLRDCKLLTVRGYELVSVVPFDSNPHTPRLEIAAQLKWRDLLQTTTHSVKESREPDTIT